MREAPTQIQSLVMASLTTENLLIADGINSGSDKDSGCYFGQHGTTTRDWREANLFLVRKCKSRLFNLKWFE